MAPIPPGHGADLTDAEVDAICAGLTQSAAKVRHLRRLGLQVQRKPNGRPLVNRMHYDVVRGAVIEAPAPQPGGIKWSVPA
jgi:hypothetical protein